MLKHVIAAALLLTPVAGKANAPKADDPLPVWYYIGITPDKSEIYALSEDLMRTDSTVGDARVWFKLDHAGNAKNPWRETRVLVSVNCPRQTYVTLSMTSYKPNGQSETNPGSGAIQYIIPDTFMDTTAKILCPVPGSR